jgi:hypothetical protein
MGMLSDKKDAQDSQTTSEQSPPRNIIEEMSPKLTESY